MDTFRWRARVMAASGPRMVSAPGSSRALLNAKNSAAGTVVLVTWCGIWIDITSGTGTTGTGFVLWDRGSGRVIPSTVHEAALAVWHMAIHSAVSSARCGSGSGGWRPAVSASPENNT